MCPQTAMALFEKLFLVEILKVHLNGLADEKQWINWNARLGAISIATDWAIYREERERDADDINAVPAERPHWPSIRIPDSGRPYCRATPTPHWLLVLPIECKRQLTKPLISWNNLFLQWVIVSLIELKATWVLRPWVERCLLSGDHQERPIAANWLWPRQRQRHLTITTVGEDNKSGSHLAAVIPNSIENKRLFENSKLQAWQVSYSCEELAALPVDAVHLKGLVQIDVLSRTISRLGNMTRQIMWQCGAGEICKFVQSCKQTKLRLAWAELQSIMLPAQWHPQNSPFSKMSFALYWKSHWSTVVDERQAAGRAREPPVPRQ